MILRQQKKSKPTFQDYLNNRQLHKEDIGKECDMLKLCINDFPYYYFPGIQHWILWKLGGEQPKFGVIGQREEGNYERINVATSKRSYSGTLK